MVSDWLSVVSSVSLALVECLLVLITFHIFPQQQMSKVLTAVEHLNQAKAEAATDSVFLCGVSLYFIYTTVVRTVHTLVVISER
jgi:hypothetical protein